MNREKSIEDIYTSHIYKTPNESIQIINEIHDEFEAEIEIKNTTINKLSDTIESQELLIDSYTEIIKIYEDDITDLQQRLKDMADMF